MSVESLSVFVAFLAAAISSLLGRTLLSVNLEEFAGEEVVAFDEVIVSVKLEEAWFSSGLFFMLVSGAEGVPISISPAFSLSCDSFCMSLGFEDGFGITGTIGLIAALVVTLD